jgi:hypothetical protein
MNCVKNGKLELDIRVPGKIFMDKFKIVEVGGEVIHCYILWEKFDFFK